MAFFEIVQWTRAHPETGHSPAEKWFSVASATLEVLFEKLKIEIEKASLFWGLEENDPARAIELLRLFYPDSQAQANKPGESDCPDRAGIEISSRGAHALAQIVHPAPYCSVQATGLDAPEEAGPGHELQPEFMCEAPMCGETPPINSDTEIVQVTATEAPKQAGKDTMQMTTLLQAGLPGNNHGGHTPEKSPHEVEMAGQIAAINSAWAVIEFRMDGTIITANENFLKTMGYTLGEITGKHHRMFVEDSLAGSPEYGEFWKALARGEFQSGDFKRMAKGGSEVWLQAQYSPIPDAAGVPSKVVKYASDITSRKRLEAEAGRIKAMVENAPINIIMADKEFNITYMNPASLQTLRRLESYLPVKADQVVGQNIDIFHKNPSHQRGMLADPKNLPHRALIAIGPESAELLVSAIYDKDGQYSGPMVTWEVVTDKIRLEGEQARLKALVENAPINIMMADKEFNITYVNPASMGTLTKIKHLLPIDPAQIVGANIDIFHKNPTHQRGILADPKNLPRHAKINIGDEIADLLVSPMYDSKGEYLGPMVTWEIITERERVEVSIKQMAQTLAASSEELTAVSGQMSANAEETSTQANVVAAASEQVSKNVETVATSTDQMGAAIREIASSSNQAARVAQDAVALATETNRIMGKLDESSTGIGQVIKVITSIAEQTKLLALNATIEAARAGEAGKGFAVVANEVKELAKETAKATEDIGKKIEGIQSDTKGAVDAIGRISGVINQINDIQNTIAGAVEEQTATTNEISRNVAEAAKGSAEIAQNICGVAQAAQNTAAGSTQVQSSSGELSRLASEMQLLLKRNGE